MKPRIISYTHKILLATTIIFYSFVSVRACAEELVKIKAYPDVLINEYFYGFGAETLPWLWTKENKEMGVDQADIALNLERIKSMQLPITRIFVPWETWNPSADYETFTWEGDAMTSLYNILDIYQETGTSVIIVTVDWLSSSPWEDIEASSRAVLELLEYLVLERGYNCIRFWTLTNEPELTYGWLNKLPFENYVQVHNLVKQGLEKRGLPIKIIVSGEVESLEWFEKSVESLLSVADFFSSHEYFSPGQVDKVAEFFESRLEIIKDATPDRTDIPFFLGEFGFRGSDFGVRTNSLMQEYEYGLFVASLAIDALNSGVAAASIWCLHQIRLISEIESEGGKMMRIGLWAYKDEGWRPFPIFYLYQLFTKYIRPGSKVLKTEIAPLDILKAACVEYDGNYSLIIVNLTDEIRNFSIKGLDLISDFKKYVYSQTYFAAEQGGLDKSVLQVKTNTFINDSISPKSVVVYTNLADKY